MRGRQLLDITGHRFGKLVVIRRTDVKSGNNLKWECLCDCGKTTLVCSSSLVQGRTKSCGCVKPEGNIKDLSGMVFEKLRVVSQAGKTKWGNVKWVCVCECGNWTEVAGGKLKSGHTGSCGCLRLKHGMADTPMYRTWCSMKSRCYSIDNPNYGGRGIKVCDRWSESFENFLDDMGECGSEDSIERINVNGHYTPENCKWIPKTEQNRNKRTSVHITYNNETMLRADWVRKLGGSKSWLGNLTRVGYSREEAIKIKANGGLREWKAKMKEEKDESYRIHKGKHGSADDHVGSPTREVTCLC